MRSNSKRLSKNFSKIITLLLIPMIFTSCYTRKAVVSSSRPIHSGAMKVNPKWHRKPSILTWSMPVTWGLAGYGAGYYAGKAGRNTNGLSATDNGIYLGVITGALATSLLFKMAKSGQLNTRSESVTATDWNKWLRKYDATHRGNYVLIDNSPYGGPLIAPKKRVDEFWGVERQNQFDALVKKGDQSRRSRYFDQAISNYQRALNMNVNNLLARHKIQETYSDEFRYYMNQGNNAIRNGNFYAARNWYQRGLNMGVQGNSSEARNLIDEIPRKEYMYYIDKANEAFANEDYDKALRYLDKARGLNYSGDDGYASRRYDEVMKEKSWLLRHVTKFWMEGLFEDKVFSSFVLSREASLGTKGDMSNQMMLYIESEREMDINFQIVPSEEKFLKMMPPQSIHLKKGLNWIIPDIAWKREALSGQISNATLELSILLTDESNKTKTKAEKIELMNVNQCILMARAGKEKKAYNFKEMLAAYVQETHPEIDKILKEAMDKGYINGVVGYQAGAQYVDKQVSAVFRVLHDRGFRYASRIIETENENIAYQEVYTISQSLDMKAGNCIDGTVLMASVLMRMGIRPVIVVRPGHAYLAYYRYPASSQRNDLGFVETTMVGMSLGINGKAENKMTRNEKDLGFENLFMKAQNKAHSDFKDYVYKDQLEMYDIVALRKKVKPIVFNDLVLGR
ncbi:MAG: hypothetical protein MRZ79_07060 [Bacteroidia bacterium]|nr:hypothetical protein [Bacteroidia bacterium]